MDMLFSSSEKLALSGWFYENNAEEYYNSLKLQKFLFFYEMFSESEGKETDFYSLQGWKDGPVFGTVYGDYTYRQSEFLAKARDTLKESVVEIDEKVAKLSSFLVSVMTKKELSSLTHEFNMWKSQEDRINANERRVSLSKNDLNEADLLLLEQMKNSYSSEYIDSVELIKIRDKVFIIENRKLSQLTDIQKDTLHILALDEALINPVYVNINENGVLVVD